MNLNMRGAIENNIQGGIDGLSVQNIVKTQVTVLSLSNDPGKTGSNFFYYGAILFPHIEIFSFSHREYINLQKDSYQNMLYLNSIFKGCFLC